MLTEKRRSPLDDDLVRESGQDLQSRISVSMTDTLGTIFLGLLSVILLIALLRAYKRNRVLAAQLVQRRG
jgi:hypothetical protein